MIFDLAPLVILRQGAISNYEKLAKNYSYPNSTLTSPFLDNEIAGSNRKRGQVISEFLAKHEPIGLTLNPGEVYQQHSWSSNHFALNDLINYCDKCITKLILGQNLSSEVQSGSLAAAKVHQETLHQKIQSIITYTNSIASYICNMILKANNINANIKFEYHSVVPIDSDLVKSIALLTEKSGISFTKEFFISRLGFKDDDIDTIVPPVINTTNSGINNATNSGAANLSMQLAKDIAQSNVENLSNGNTKYSEDQQVIEELAKNTIEQHNDTFTNDVLTAIDKSNDKDELMASFALLLENMKATDFTKLDDALITANVVGYVQEKEQEV
jgi:phage gp29-like protein